MACVRLRSRPGKEPQWVCDFYDGRGDRRVLVCKAKNERDARKELLGYLSQIETGKFSAASEQRNFLQLTEAYLASLDRQVRKFTLIDYQSVINTHLKVYFGSMKLRAITVLEVEKFRTWLQKRPTRGGSKKLSERTVNKSLTTLSQMLNYAEKHRWLDFNPCKHVKKLPQTIGHRRRALDGNIYTWSECERLVACAPTPRDAALFLMAVTTGMRQGELLGLKWDDVDEAGCRVHVRHSCRRREDNQVKTAASLRTIGLTPQLVRELQAWKLVCPRRQVSGGAVLDLVFPNRAGGWEDAHNLVRRGLHPAIKKAGLRRVRFHDLRHTCASLLLAAGVPLKSVQAHLGHSSANVTLDVYGHLLPATTSPGADAFHAMANGNAVVARTREEVTTA